MRAWHYGPGGEAAIFEQEADVPQGWRDHPFRPDPAVGEGRKGGSPAGRQALRRKAKG